nr:probable disease resistance protein At4g27220 isoform X1 [Coffea arabica]
MSNHNPSRMAVDAALGGSSLTFAYAVVKDLCVYMKHRRRHVKDLLDNLEYLGLEADILHARWHDYEEDIDRRAGSVQRRLQHGAWKKVVFRLLHDYKKIIEKYRKMTAATGNQRRQEVEGSNRAVENERSTNAPIHELPDISHLREHKLWTKKFFKLARLDKDIMKLREKIASARKDIQLADLTGAVRPKAVIRMEDAKNLDVMPSHKKILDELLGELQTCGVEAEAEAEAEAETEAEAEAEVEAEAEAKAKLKRIAICGEAQVGKTNIMKNLNNWFDSCPPSVKLDYVIWVTVPTNLHEKENVIKTIQEIILRRLELTEQISTIDKNKDTISTELREKSYLLLFEGFSSSIQLGEIGVSYEHKHGIVVIETTDPVLLRSFGFDQKIKVEKLPYNDSRKLFDKIMEGEKLSKECCDLIGLILKELGGLPGVISFIATLLKSKIDAEFWGTIKDKLTADVGESEDLGLGGLFKAFEIAYEGLKEDRCKSCLLYAALFPKGFTIPINVLVECWKAEGFLCCPAPTFLKARGDGIFILHKLTGHYLLESCSEQYVKMPILFRRFAIRTTFPGEKVGTSFVRSGPKIDGHLKDEEWKMARRVSLIQSQLEELPVSLECGGISTLFLQLNPDLRSIKEPFFTTLKELRVLDLHSTGIQLLPSSISSLTELRSLYLNNCGDLTELPSKIVKLTKLEVLDIRDTSIHCLPEEVSSLVGLRCLRFSFAPGMCNPNPKPRLWERIVRRPNYRTTVRRVIFPPGAADQLSKLEEMTIVLVNGSSDGIVDRIEAEVLEFKNKNSQFKLILHRPSQSLDQRNPVQLRGEGITLPNQSVAASQVHDPTTGNQSPRSDNEGRSRGGTTNANSQARRKDKGKGLAIFKPKNKARNIGVVIREPLETNGSRVDIHEEANVIVDQQVDRVTVDAIDRPKFLDEASTSGTARGAD